jgi:hypothetical protein
MHWKACKDKRVPSRKSIYYSVYINHSCSPLGLRLRLRFDELPILFLHQEQLLLQRRSIRVAKSSMKSSIRSQVKVVWLTRVKRKTHMDIDTWILIQCSATRTHSRISFDFVLQLSVRHKTCSCFREWSSSESHTRRLGGCWVDLSMMAVNITLPMDISRTGMK